MTSLEISEYPVPFAHGFAVIDRQGKSLYEQGNLTRVFSLASVTKVITAMATHLAVQEGYLSLAQPGGPAGSTVMHLLSHASGLAPDGDGNLVVSAPGITRIYSNQGYDVVQAVLEEHTGQPFMNWLNMCLIEPLGIEKLRVQRSAASSGVGNIMDLSLVAQELLKPKLLSTCSLAALSTPVFPELRGVLPGYGGQRPNLWGMGAEVRGKKHPHWTAPGASPETFGHFGVSGSFLWVDPNLGVAAMFLGEEFFSQWHKENWPVMSQLVLDALG